MVLYTNEICESYQIFIGQPNLPVRIAPAMSQMPMIIHFQQTAIGMCLLPFILDWLYTIQSYLESGKTASGHIPRKHASI